MHLSALRLVGLGRGRLEVSDKPRDARLEEAANAGSVLGTYHTQGDTSPRRTTVMDG